MRWPCFAAADAVKHFLILDFKTKSFCVEHYTHMQIRFWGKGAVGQLTVPLVEFSRADVQSCIIKSSKGFLRAQTASIVVVVMELAWH